jgi:glycine cleavage system regulatory protein
MELFVKHSLIFTFIGPDRPGLVDKLARAVSETGGNWLESRMSQLAGQFAGIVRVAVPADRAEMLDRQLQLAAGDELTLTVFHGDDAEQSEKAQARRLQILGNDRPGIVSEVARALAVRRINVREMNTNVSSAPMTAEMLFEAIVDIELPADTELDELQDELELMADQLGVDITLSLQPAQHQAGQ